MIIELAQTGERDPDFLCEAVLAALRAAGLFDHEARCWEPYALARNYDVAAVAPLSLDKLRTQPRFDGADLSTSGGHCA